MPINIRETKKISTNSIGTIINLCKALDITKSELKEALHMEPSERYRYNEVPKSNGTIRKTYNPHPLIRKIQRRINRRIFNSYDQFGKKVPTIKWASYIFGSIPNQLNDSEDIIESKDYIACAKIHCPSKSLFKIDIKDFFDNIHATHVNNIFTNFFKFKKTVSDALTNICCLDEHLVQGALTSSYLACLCLFDVEHAVVKRLNFKNLRYTRLVDDITISSTIANYDFSFAKKIVIDMLSEKDLPINKNKTGIYYISTVPLTVHGLTISYDNPRLPADEAKRIRAAVKNIEVLASEPNYRTSHWYRKDFNKCMGRVNKLMRVHHPQYSNLAKRLLKILPLPTYKDIARIEKSVKRLEKDYADKKNNTFWYNRRFFRTHERINILQRTYTEAARKFRDKLKMIKPENN